MEIITAHTVLPIDHLPITDGAIVVDHGEILDVGKKADMIARYPNSLVEEHPQHILLPGLVNAHTHLEMTQHKNFPFDPVRSMALDVSFVDWLLSYIDYKKNTTPQQKREAIKLGVEALIESGTTCAADMGSFEGMFQVLEEAGLRSVIFPEMMFYDNYAAQDLFETAMALIEKYMDYESDLISVGVGPYSAYLLSRNILRIMSQYGKMSSLPVKIHAAESFEEMEFFYNATGDMATRLFPNLGWAQNLPPAFGKTPIRYLDDIGFLEAAPLIVGCNHATDDDISRLAHNHAKVVWCPRSDNFLKKPAPPISKLMEKQITIALGTEGISSVNNLSMWDELRMAKEISRAQKWNLNSRELLEMATLKGAASLGLDSEIGSLTKGKRADYILISAKNLKKGADVHDFLIDNTKTFDVEKVVINGRTVKILN